MPALFDDWRETLFRDYDDYRRRYGRSQPQAVTEIPVRSPHPNDLRSENGRLRQELTQIQATAAEWRETAENWYATAKQQQADLKRLEKELAAANRQLAALQQQFNGARQRMPETAVTPPTAVNDGDDWREKYIRLAAELENNKKRLEQRYTLETQQNQEKLLRAMLPLADNLERALTHQASVDAAGLALIRRAFLATLAEFDVTPLEVKGRPFDPELHEAVGLLPHPQAESGTVIAVEETGYTYQGKLLRPARVLVAA